MVQTPKQAIQNSQSLQRRQSPKGTRGYPANQVVPEVPAKGRGSNGQRLMKYYSIHLPATDTTTNVGENHSKGGWAKISPAASDKMGTQTWDLWPQSFLFHQQEQMSQEVRGSNSTQRSINSNQIYFVLPFCHVYVCMVCIVCRHACRHGVQGHVCLHV